MWERCCGGYSESPVPILTRACLKSALHMGLLSKISLKQRVSTAKMIKKSQGALEANIKGLIPYEPFLHLSIHSMNVLSICNTQGSHRMPSNPHQAPPKMNC